MDNEIVKVFLWAKLCLTKLNVLSNPQVPHNVTMHLEVTPF